MSDAAATTAWLITGGITLLVIIGAVAYIRYDYVHYIRQIRHNHVG